MTKEEVLRILHEHEAELYAQGVKALYLFGSVARGDQRPDSDVDLLVEFSVPTGYFGLFRLQEYLEGIIGQAVDLVTPGALRQEFRDEVLKEAVRAA